jgi:hypothetical protein
MLDEVGASDVGIEHDFDFECGSVLIHASDLRATWR